MPHLDALYGMAVRLTHDPGDAEDLVQDALVKAFRFFHRYEPDSNIKAWLFKVLVNTFYNAVRKHRNTQKLHTEAEVELHYQRFVSEATTGAQTVEADLLDRLVVEKLRAAVADLPEEFQLAVLLCDIHGFSYKEIAEILGCPVGTVMSRLYRGRRLLQKTLYDYAVEQGYVKEAPQDGGQGAADLDAYRRRRRGGA